MLARTSRTMHVLGTDHAFETVPTSPRQSSSYASRAPNPFRHEHNARSLEDEPTIRLILDGTGVRVRLDKKSTAISVLDTALAALWADMAVQRCTVHKHRNLL